MSPTILAPTRSKRVLALVASAAVAAWTLSPLAGFASSHREAPFISQDAAVDNTDTYVFRSPADPTKVVFVANSYPFHYPEGGPNYFRFADNALYVIHVDTNGDARENVSFVFKFTTTIANTNTFLYNTGAIMSLNDANLNVRQTWKLYRVRGVFTGSAAQLRQENVIATSEIAPPVIGPRSIPDYNAVANQAIVSNSHGKFFAGERDDPFFVDLNVFDLLGLGGAVDSVAGANVNSLVVEVPIASLVGRDPVIGVWAANYRPAQIVLRGDGTMQNSTTWVQVSRLGMPLVNEVVIPLGLKNAFNALKPVNDANVQPAVDAVLTPELANLMKVVLGLDFDGTTATVNIPTTNRTDLVTIFLTGIPDLNKPITGRPSEMLRLNTTTAVNQSPNRLGVFGNDLQGFPNGRRLADDVTDIAIQAVAGKIVDGFNVPEALGDGVNANDKPFLATFPYVAPPHLARIRN